MKNSGAFCSAILRVINPDQYWAGRMALMRARQDVKGVREALQSWPSIFGSVQVLSNRESPYHRDFSSYPSSMDLLVTLGTYDRLTFSVRNLGMQIAYRPGTAIVMSSFVVHHGVAEVDPDRVCYAWYMPKHLHQNYDISSCAWMTHDMYINA